MAKKAKSYRLKQLRQAWGAGKAAQEKLQGKNHPCFCSSSCEESYTL